MGQITTIDTAFAFRFDDFGFRLIAYSVNGFYFLNDIYYGEYRICIFHMVTTMNRGMKNFMILVKLRIISFFF